MGEAGIFTEDDRVELIEGEVVEMSAIGSRHAACIEKIATLIRRTVPSESAAVRVQNPVHLSHYSEPQPDISVVRPRPDFYASGHPTADDVLFLVEVADASLTYDRHTKFPLYARSGIAEAWLVDLVNHLVEVYTAPGAAGYEHVRRFQGAAALPHIEIAASEILV